MDNKKNWILDPNITLDVTLRTICIYKKNGIQNDILTFGFQKYEISSINIQNGFLKKFEI